MFNCLIKGPLYTKQITTFQKFALISLMRKSSSIFVYSGSISSIQVFISQKLITLVLGQAS